MSQSKFIAITCNLFKARETSQVQGAIGFDFASHWLKNSETFLSQSQRVAIALLLSIVILKLLYYGGIPRENAVHKQNFNAKRSNH